jgi:hypothetical protein
VGGESVFSVALCVVVVVVFCLVCLILLLLLLILPLYKFEIGRGFLKEKTVRCFLFGSCLLLSVCFFWVDLGSVWVLSGFLHLVGFGVDEEGLG